jgi:Domain of unknown function (DUF4375)
MIDPDRAIEIADAACERVGFNESLLSWPLLVVYLISQLNVETILGGAYGWLGNEGGHGPDTAKALETVGAHRCAAIVREMLSYFPDSTPSLDIMERSRQMEDIGEVGEKAWRELGNRLLTWPDDINALLQKFINEHEADFT